jgi:hypothetical protein
VLQLALVVRRSTLVALSEHSSAAALGGSIPLGESEAIVLLDAEVVRRLLEAARPEDTRLDDVIMRMAL